MIRSRIRYGKEEQRFSIPEDFEQKIKISKNSLISKGKIKPVTLNLFKIACVDLGFKLFEKAFIDYYKSRIINGEFQETKLNIQIIHDRLADYFKNDSTTTRTFLEWGLKEICERHKLTWTKTEKSSKQGLLSKTDWIKTSKTK